MYKTVEVIYGNFSFESCMNVCVCANTHTRTVQSEVKSTKIYVCYYFYSIVCRPFVWGFFLFLWTVDQQSRESERDMMLLWWWRWWRWCGREWETELPEARFKIYEKLSLSPPTTLMLGIMFDAQVKTFSFECVSPWVCVCVRSGAGLRVRCACNLGGGFISIQFGNKTIIPQKLLPFCPASRK